MKILLAPYPQKLRREGVNPKAYPHWQAVIAGLRGHQLVQIGVEGEEPLVGDFRKGLPLMQVEQFVRQCDLWISVDSFLQHLAAHQGKRGIVLWGPSDPNIFGYPDNVNLLRDRAYLRKNQFGVWEELEYNPDIFVQPEAVLEAVNGFNHEQVG